jgi:S1-C subfamily serine protease
MDLNFLELNDRPPLIRVMTQFARRGSDEDRRNALEVAGVDSGFLNQLHPGLAPDGFAQELVAKFGQYSISSNRPDYHPMLRLLDYLHDNTASYSFSDDDQDLLTRLIDQGEEKLKALAALNTVGRIESPLGTGIGSGVLIGQGILLTCDHVFTDIRQAWVRFGCKDKNSCQTKPAFELDLKNFVSHRQQPDHAVLRIETSKPIPPVKIQPIDGSLNNGQPIRLIHHPLGQPAAISEVGQILQVGADYIDHNLKTDKGSSGAPIFNSKWELIAIHQGLPGIRRSGINGAVGGIPIRAFWPQIEPYLD